MSRLYSIESGTSAQIVAKMLRVLFPDAETVLDMTYGSGKFWTDTPPWHVTGIDLDPARARDVCADFTRLPFADGAFDVAIFDPPYLSACSKQGTAQMGSRFAFFATDDDLRDAVCAGVAEAWRVARLGVIAKVQNYSHSGRAVRMTAWVESMIPEAPYGEVHSVNLAKMLGASWGPQLSVYSVHTTYLAFRHGSQMHVRRGRQDPVAVEVASQPGLFESEAAG